MWTRANAYALASFGPLSPQQPFLGTASQHEHFNADTGEAGIYLTGQNFNVVAGGSTFTGRDQNVVILSGRVQPTVTSPIDDKGMWIYGNLIPDPAFRLTLGGHLDELRSFVNRTEFDPKLGLTWDALPGTTLRAAWFETLKRPLIGDPSFRRGQTIEPTQVAGFDQLYDDFNGTTDMVRYWIFDIL